jgi:enolase
MTHPITSIAAWEALDSRGHPTVAAQITVGGSHQAVCLAPAGASAGGFEAVFLRDQGEHYRGLSVRGVIEKALPILRDALIGVDAGSPEDVHLALRTIDDSPAWNTLGGNVVTAVSIACWLAVASAEARPPWQVMAEWTGRTPTLPRPMVNIVSGGAHAGRAVDIQDVLAIATTATSVEDALETIAAIRHETSQLMAASGHPVHLVADEGGLAGAFSTNADAVDVVAHGIAQVANSTGQAGAIALDIAANQFFDGSAYRFDGQTITSGELVAVLEGWVERWPVVSIEDPLAETDDWSPLSRLTSQIQIIGDDRYATQAARVLEGIAAAEANSVLVKPNQAGTLRDALATLHTAVEAGWAPVVSARSGETEQDWLVDLAVGTGAGQIKVGSTHRSERTAKWNRLLQLSAQTSLPYTTTTQ